MKKKILKKLRQIKKMADLTGIDGVVYVYFFVNEFPESFDSGRPDWSLWDKTLESITEFPKYKHVFELNGLNVHVILLV